MIQMKASMSYPLCYEKYNYLKGKFSRVILKTLLFQM